MKFGQYVKELRLEENLSLRKFCELVGVDASNWSKVERGLIPLTQDTDKLNTIAAALKLEKNTSRFIKFFDLAAVAKREIPEYVYSDEELLNALPVFFRTAGNIKPTKEELEKLVELIKRR